MKTMISFLLSASVITFGYSQNTKPATATSTKKKTVNNKSTTQASGSVQTTATAPLQMRETATDRYLNGTKVKGSSNTGNQTATGTASPFAAGIHPADNAAKTFDTLHNQNSVNSTSINTTVAGGNDTTFNVNTVNDGGVTTNSGAVDRSGQAQFGQTNWGDSRSTVGESQWTIPPPITASFNKEFPSASNAAWARSNVDTSLFSARYKSGANWVTANYNAAGERLDMRTEIPMVQPPRPVSAYLAKQPTSFHAVTINRLQVQGKADVFEILTQTGKTIYINNDGAEVTY